MLRAFALAVGRVPFPWLGPLGACVGWLAGTVLRIRRAHVVASMRAAGIADAERTAHRMYRALGIGVVEFLWLAGGARRRLEDFVLLEPGSREALALAFRGGRGVVFAGAHTGNWELAACAIATERELLVVAKRLSVGAIDRFARGVRSRWGIELADPDGALSVAQATLSRGGAVTMLIDQRPLYRRHAIVAPFLGRAAFVDRAAAALAWRARAPLVVVGARRNGDGTHTVSVLSILIPEEGREWIERASREATRRLEMFVLEYPTEWLWLHRRWRAPEADGPPDACFSARAPLHGPRHA